MLITASAPGVSDRLIWSISRSSRRVFCIVFLMEVRVCSSFEKQRSASAVVTGMVPTICSRMDSSILRNEAVWSRAATVIFGRSSKITFDHFWGHRWYSAFNTVYGPLKNRNIHVFRSATLPIASRCFFQYAKQLAHTSTEHTLLLVETKLNSFTRRKKYCQFAIVMLLFFFHQICSWRTKFLFVFYRCGAN